MLNNWLCCHSLHGQFVSETSLSCLLINWELVILRVRNIHVKDECIEKKLFITAVNGVGSKSNIFLAGFVFSCRKPLERNS